MELPSNSLLLVKPMPHGLTRVDVHDLQVFSSAFISKDSDRCVVDELQIQGIDISGGGHRPKPLEDSFPQLPFPLQVVGNDGAPWPSSTKIGINQHITAQGKDRTVMTNPGKDFLALLHQANGDGFALALRAD